MKISISLPDDDVSFIDEFGAQSSNSSRSAVIHQAVGLLRAASIETAYTEAWDEWAATTDAELWDAIAADELADASR
ncbi:MULTISPECIES: ribbon-helix-helix domain-containing protein [unclassified Frankia]|uniref:ribbon-helix-helix domain-containing protein n=1 Tax=unclassified Frankia TaxID=2632575 RepID=UPI002AD2C97F|nr:MULTISPECIES: ribbon-helix-helix domain-containing protein [unclassified Frankia]